jgi:glycine betaine/proline transport system substrate-binding protein
MNGCRSSSSQHACQQNPSPDAGTASARLSRRSFLIAGAGALVGAAGRVRADAPIILGQVSLSFYAVAGAVVHEILERMGHTVELRQGPHDEIFPMLGDSAIDLMAACWLPEGHAAYWAKYGGNAMEVARLYDGARFFWAVPDYVPASEVASIADLAKPAVAQRMTKVIQGIGTAAVITTVSQKAVGEYGLDSLGYSLRPGKPAEWTGAYDAAVAEVRWIVFPTWAPQYLNRGGKLRPLQDPRGILGGVNHASLVAPRGRFQALPATTRAVLARIDLGLDGVTEMDWLVNVGKKTPREAARLWMQANDGRVSGWFR